MFSIHIITATLLSVLFLTTDRALADVVFDYAVVGGGAAGLALAARLSEDPSISVVVLEAGVNGNKIEYDALEVLGATGWNWNTMFAASKK
ncbi:hypothetical protein C0993_005976, partial [Termitomyces sp. T159_Od127]